MEDDMSFCQQCGSKYEIPNGKGNKADKIASDMKNSVRKGNQSFLSKLKTPRGNRILGIICIVFSLSYLGLAISSDLRMIAMTPFMLIIGIMFLILSKIPSEQKHIKSEKGVEKGMKKTTFIALCLVIAFILFTGCLALTGGIGFENTASPNESNTHKAGATDAHEDTAETAVPQDGEATGIDIENISDSSSFDLEEPLRTGFINACTLIGIYPEQIKDFDQVSNWVGGSRYSFTYSNMPFLLYCNMDATINSINLGDYQIYLQGYEPYQVADYIVNASIATELQTAAEKYVKDRLNYPSTADFSWLDWSFGRDHELYSVASHVKAKNGLGVESDIPFKLIFSIDGGTKRLVYFELDNNLIIDELSTIPTRDRARIETDNTSNTDDGIILTYGQSGVYGQTVVVDGESEIVFRVPEGTYVVTNRVNWCKVFIAKDTYFKNADGFMKNEIIEIIELTAYGEEQTITIHSGEQIELTIGASVALVPIE